MSSTAPGQKYYRVPYAWKKLIAYLVIVTVIFFIHKGITYLWSTTAITQTISNLAANTYTVTIADINNCTASSSNSLINTGNPSIAAFVIDSVNCFGGSDGSVNISISGGVPVYSFLWNDGNTNEDRTGLSANTYTVTVTDQKSCTTAQSFIVSQPAQVTVSMSKTDATCGNNNGTATANPSGGTGGITFMWNTSAVSQIITNLPASTYTVTVTDIYNCTATNSVNVNNANGPVITTVVIDSVVCFLAEEIFSEGV